MSNVKQLYDIPDWLPKKHPVSNNSERALLLWPIENDRESYTMDKTSRVIYINLDYRQDRNQRFLEKYPWSLDNVYRFPAVNGKELFENAHKNDENTLEYLNEILGDDNWNRFTRGEIGIILSQYHIWENIVKENLTNVVVFEDDVLFYENCFTYWEKASNLIPEDYDILYLGQTGSAPPNNDSPIMKTHSQRVNDCWFDIKNVVKKHGNVRQLKRITSWLGCVGFIISNQGAKKLLKYAQKYGFHEPLDHWFFSRFHELNVYILDNWLCFSFQHYISGDTDIQS